MNTRHSLMTMVFGAICFLGSGCLNPSQNIIPSSPTSGSGGDTTPGGGPSSPNATAKTIAHFQPALAVRDISCLSCHANVQSSVLTDFGHGSSWYMGGLTTPSDFGSLHYEATSWQTLEQISGTLIVPDNATIPASYLQGELQSGSTAPAAGVSLASYLTLTDVLDFGGSWYQYFNEPQPATTAFADKVSGGVSAQNFTFYIGAPTASNILQIVNNGNPAPWFQAVNASLPLSGFSVSSNQKYVVASGQIDCAGQDVVINGTLLINDGEFNAGNGGCRLYVTGSVFIEGPITYLGEDPTSNLQITSSTSIIMGVGLNGEAWNGDGSIDDSGSTPLEVRLISDARGNMFLRGAPTASAYQSYANGILAEGNNIGLPLLQDASVIPTGAPVAKSAAGQGRVMINFNHLLLNAPLIHSRYMGTFSGVIVAESAMFSLGEFVFNYDPIFANVPILPALPNDVLCADEDNCNPVPQPSPTPTPAPTPPHFN